MFKKEDTSLRKDVHCEVGEEGEEGQRKDWYRQENIGI